jgi:hypothetical protein
MTLERQKEPNTATDNVKDIYENAPVLETNN